MTVDPTQELRRAADLANQGHHQEALDLLQRLVAADADFKHAWWGIAATSRDPIERRRAVNNVLRLDPQDQRALALQERLDADNVPEVSLVEESPEDDSFELPDMDEADPDANMETFIDMPAVQPDPAPTAIGTESRPDEDEEEDLPLPDLNAILGLDEADEDQDLDWLAEMPDVQLEAILTEVEEDLSQVVDLDTSTDPIADPLAEADEDDWLAQVSAEGDDSDIEAILPSLDTRASEDLPEVPTVPTLEEAFEDENEEITLLLREDLEGEEDFLSMLSETYGQGDEQDDEQGDEDAETGALDDVDALMADHVEEMTEDLPPLDIDEAEAIEIDRPMPDASEEPDWLAEDPIEAAAKPDLAAVESTAPDVGAIDMSAWQGEAEGLPTDDDLPAEADMIDAMAADFFDDDYPSIDPRAQGSDFVEGEAIEGDESEWPPVSEPVSHYESATIGEWVEPEGTDRAAGESGHVVQVAERFRPPEDTPATTPAHPNEAPEGLKMAVRFVVGFMLARVIWRLLFGRKSS